MREIVHSYEDAKKCPLLRREDPPDFLAQLDNENRDVKTELSELQVQHIDEPINDDKDDDAQVHCIDGPINGDNDDKDDNSGNYRCSKLRQSTNWRRQEIFCESRFHKRYSSSIEC